MDLSIASNLTIEQISAIINSIAAIGTFLITIVIAYFAFRGLDQLKISKDTSKMHAKRESYILAAEQCKFYNEKIIPLQDIFFDAVKKKNVNFYKNYEVKIINNKITAKYMKGPKDFKKDLSKLKEITCEYVSMVNSMETFSLYFDSGIAAEEIAFKLIGDTFCNTMKDILPDILMIKKSGTKEYETLLRLFILWNNRIERNKLIENKNNINSKLKDLKSETIIPLGTR